MRELFILLRKEWMYISRCPGALFLFFSTAVLSPTMYGAKLLGDSAKSTRAHKESTSSAISLANTSRLTGKHNGRMRLALVGLNHEQLSAFSKETYFLLDVVTMPVARREFTEKKVEAIISRDGADAASASDDSLNVVYRMTSSSPTMIGRLKTTLYELTKTAYLKNLDRQCPWDKSEWWRVTDFKFTEATDVPKVDIFEFAYPILAGCYMILYMQGLLCKVLITDDNQELTAISILVTPASRKAIILAKTLILQLSSLGMQIVYLLGTCLTLFHDRAGHDWSSLSILQGCLAAAVIVGSTGPVLSMSACTSKSIYEFSSRFLLCQCVVVLAMLVCLLPYGTQAPGLVLVPVANASICIVQLMQSGHCNPFFYAGSILICVLFSVATIVCGAKLIDPEAIVTGQEALQSTPVSAMVRASLLVLSLLILTIFLALPVMATAKLRWIWDVVLLAVFFVSTLCYRMPLRDAAGLTKFAPAYTLLGLALAPVLVAADAMFQQLLSVIPRFTDVLLLAERHALLKHPGWLNVVWLACSPAVLEEIVLRGVLVNMLVGKVPTFYLILGIGILSGILHPLTADWVPNTVLGIVLTWLRLRSGSTVPCMALHAVYNGLRLLTAPL